jgi:WD40 repeat protein
LFLRRENLLLSSAMDHKIKLTDWVTKQLIIQFDHHNSTPLGPILSKNEEICLSVGADGKIIFIEMKTGKIIWNLNHDCDN